MSRKVAVVGMGQTVFRSVSPELSYKELMYEAATKAYADAGVDPRSDVQSFVSCAEDFAEGVAIFDCYVPDQLGAVLSPVHTICGDGIYGLISAYMQIKTGQLDVVAVAAHSKASNLLTPTHITALAMDPVFNRPLGVHPYFVAGLEMSRFLFETGNTRDQCALVSVKNHRNALDNPQTTYVERVSLEDVLGCEHLFHSMGSLDISSPADGAVVIVVASEERARELAATPVWIKGVGWCSDSYSLESRDWAGAVYAELSARMAYKMAGIRNPRRAIDLAEVDDTFSYKELQHLEALGLARKGEAGVMLQEGVTQREGEFPVNVSGGSLGVGNLGETSGLMRVAELVLQLRGEAGKRQVPKAQTALAQSWRGVPTSSGAVIILSNKE